MAGDFDEKENTQNKVTRNEYIYLFSVMQDWNMKATLPSMFHYKKK